MFFLQAYGIRDPAVLAHQQPIVAWASVIWNQRQPIPTLDRALQWAMTRLEGQQAWRRCCGPTHAYILTCRRLNWQPITAHTIQLDDGRMLDLREVPPRVVGDEVRHAVYRWTWRTASRNLSEPRKTEDADRVVVADAPASAAHSAKGTGRGVVADAPASAMAGEAIDEAFVEGIRYLIVSKFRQDINLQSSLINIVSGAIPTQDQVRLLRASRQEIPPDAPARCPVCLQSTAAGYGHWWWQCALTQAWRHQYTLTPGRVPAADAAASLWAQRGLANNPVRRQSLTPARIDQVTGSSLVPSTRMAQVST